MATDTSVDTFDFPSVPAHQNLPVTALEKAGLPAELMQWATIWQDLPSDRYQAPEKSLLGIPMLGRLAPYIVIFERFGADQYKIRLAGTEVEQWMDHQLTGMDPLMLVPPPQRKRVAHVYNNVTDLPCGFYIIEAIMLSRGKQAQVSALKLPLADADGTIRFFLTAYHFAEAEYVTTLEEKAPAIHRKIDRLGYIDIGFGYPQ